MPYCRACVDRPRIVLSSPLPCTRDCARTMARLFAGEISSQTRFSLHQVSNILQLSPTAVSHNDHWANSPRQTTEKFVKKKSKSIPAPCPARLVYQAHTFFPALTRTVPRYRESGTLEPMLRARAPTVFVHPASSPATHVGALSLHVY